MGLAKADVTCESFSTKNYSLDSTVLDRVRAILRKTVRSDKFIEKRKLCYIGR
jgi:hypothetical protein